MEGANKLLMLLQDLAEQLPSILTVLACMIVAMLRWKRHPRVSLVVLAGLGLVLVETFGSSIAYTWGPDWFIASADDVARETAGRNVYLVLGLIFNGFLAVAFVMLLAAVFMRRGLPHEAR